MPDGQHPDLWASSGRGRLPQPIRRGAVDHETRWGVLSRVRGERHSRRHLVLQGYSTRGALHLPGHHHEGGRCQLYEPHGHHRLQWAFVLFLSRRRPAEGRLRPRERRWVSPLGVSRGVHLQRRRLVSDDHPYDRRPGTHRQPEPVSADGSRDHCLGVRRANRGDQRYGRRDGRHEHPEWGLHKGKERRLRCGRDLVFREGRFEH